MKIVMDPVKYGPAAKKIPRTSPERLRNPAIKVFAGAPSRQVVVKDELSGMGDWWDSLTETVSQTADKLWDQTIASGQKAAVKLVEKQIMQIVGADGKVKQVPADSPEAIAYQQQYNAQQAAAAAEGTDPMMRYMMYGAAGLGVIIAIALVYKMVKK